MTREEAIDIIRDTYHTETELEALKVLLPELREREDERIRKELIELISCMHDADPRKKRWIAWLEKQKVNTEGDFKRGYDCGYQAGYAVAVNEMKPKVATATLATVTLDSEKKKDNKFAPRVLPCSAAWFEDGEDNEQKEQKLNHDKEKLIKHCIGMILTDATEKRFKDYGLTLKDCLTWLSAQKEQKPVTINQDEKEFLADEITAFLCNYDKEFDGEDPVPSEVAEHFYLLGKQAQEQKPAEGIKGNLEEVPSNVDFNARKKEEL